MAAHIFVATWSVCPWVCVRVCVVGWLWEIGISKYKYVIFAVEPFALIAFGQRVV